VGCKFGVVSSGSEMDSFLYGRYPEVGVQCGMFQDMNKRLEIYIWYATFS
jgi:hypothetical protein